MPPGVDNPTTDHPYLLQPNYYRLSYQLSAQLLNSEHPTGKRVKRVRLSKERLDPGSVLHGQTGRRACGDNLTRARIEAESAKIEAEQVLLWLQSREKGVRRILQPLDRVEKRLRDFLRRTVVPCLDLVIASSLRTTNPDEAYKRVAPLREAAAGNSLSYRALYNLACFEAGKKDTSAQALALLRRALREAPEERQRELALWAATDPAFRPLKRAKDLDGVLDAYTDQKRKR